ncbi:MAG: exodeoxyribonuclease VII large subunit, partial [Pseudomonadales bacterium]
MGKLASMGYDAYNSIMSYLPADIDQNTTANKPILSVSELNQQARSCLESQFSGVQVEGEISGLLKHRSGHWYFTLKDDEGELRAAMFSFKNKAVRFNPEDGQQVVLTGK